MTAKILVVDDEPDIEDLVMQRFRQRIRAGEFSFVFARDGQEALDVLRADSEVDIVLSDINMPRMDCLTLLGHLKKLSNLLRAIVVSAYGDMHNIRTAMNRGAYDFVTKPIDFEDLEATINKTLADLKALREVYRERAEAEHAYANLARYFSPNLAKHLAEQPDTLALAGERRELTCLVTDLADFTPLVESLEPAATVSLMNEYLGEMANIIFAHGGTINTVVGDAVSTMFGAPLDQPDHAARGVACALDLDAFGQEFVARKRTEGIPFGWTRIGVHTGTAIVGNFGGKAFFSYTAHGDVIITASRLESANKYFGTRIAVSKDTVDQIPGFVGRPVGTLVLKGKGQAVMVFEPLSEVAGASDATRAYREAFALLQAEDASAIQSFAALVGRYGEDPLATYHLKRLLAGQIGATVELPDK